MSAAVAPLRTMIASARLAVRRDASIATALAVLTVVPAVLLLAWVLSLTTQLHRSLPLLIDVAGLVIAAVVGVYAVRRWIRCVTDRAVAASAEAELGFCEGELQGVLEMCDCAPAGTSDALVRHAERGLASRLVGAGPEQLAGALGKETRRHRLRTAVAAGALFLVVGILAFASPDRSRASWAPLLSPVAAITNSALPALAVEPGDISVPRGSTVDVKINAAQRDMVTLFWRARGDVLHEETQSVRNAVATAQIPDIDATVKYWVRGEDGAVTDTFTITPIDPLLISALSIDVLYPAYLQRPAEHFDKDVPLLELPQGSELRIRGRSTRELRAVSLDRDAERFALDVDGSTFTGSFRPRESGVYEWNLAGDVAIGSAAVPAPLEIRIAMDEAPQIEITYPGVDTLLPADMKQLLVADAQDDHAVTSAVLVSWRSNATGQRYPAVEQPLSLEGDADKRLVRGVLDATSLDLLPGDTIHYFVRVTDNSPARQTAVSRTFTLRVPGMEEMRENAQQEAEQLVKDADQLSRSMKQLETRTRELQRKAVNGGARSGNRGTGGSPGSADKQQLSSEQAEAAKQVLDRQQSLTDEMQKLRDRIESLEHAAEQAGLRDPELQKRLDELKQLYDQLLTPEMKKQMAELRQALENLDPDQVQKALEQMAQQQEELRKKLDQSLDLMRRAAQEQEMSKLAQEAKELAAQQKAISDEMKNGESDPKQAAEKQKDIAQKTNELGISLAQLQKKLAENGEAQAAEKTGDAGKQTQDAKDAMSQAAKQAGQNQQQKAGESAEQASNKLNDVSKMLDNARAEMAKSWKKDTQETVDNATQDALNLAQKQKELLDRMQANMQAGNGSPQDQPQSQGQKNPGQKDQGQKGQGQQGQEQGQEAGQSAQKTPGQGAKGQQQGGDSKGQQSRESGKQQGGEAGKQGDGQKPGGEQGSQSNSGQPGGGQGKTQQLKADQAALKQGLEQLGKNLSEAGQRSALVNKEVGSALARANLSMDQTMRALEQASNEGGNMPTEQAAQTLDALNRLALELLKNGQQIEQSESGTGVQQQLEELAKLAKQQGELNGRSNSLLPLNLGPKAMSQQMGAIAQQQRDIAQKLGGMNKGGGRDDLLGRLDELVEEANQLARDLDGGRITPQITKRQAELFHKLLDAGRTIERNEVSEERKAEAAKALPPSVIRALKPGLFDDSARYAVPTAEQLRDLPPGYRRLILEYFQKLNSSDTSKEKRGE